MKPSVAYDLYQSPVTSFRLLSKDEGVLLQPFYLGLGFDSRRARFGCGVSNDSISRYCRGIISEKVLIVGCMEENGLVALIEVHLNPDQAELAFANTVQGDYRAIVYSHLLQLAVCAASKQGYCWLTVPVEHLEIIALDQLRKMGQTKLRDGMLLLKLEENARLHGFTIARL